MDFSKDYYAILGVPPSAQAETIQAVYRSLSKQYHPDVSEQKRPLAEEKMREINRAYEVLFDKERRKQYDRQRNGPGLGCLRPYEEDLDQNTAPSYSDPMIVNTR